MLSSAELHLTHTDNLLKRTRYSQGVYRGKNLKARWKQFQGAALHGSDSHLLQVGFKEIDLELVLIS